MTGRKKEKKEKGKKMEEGEGQIVEDEGPDQVPMPSLDAEWQRLKAALC